MRPCTVGRQDPQWYVVTTLACITLVHTAAGVQAEVGDWANNPMRTEAEMAEYPEHRATDLLRLQATGLLRLQAAGCTCARAAKDLAETAHGADGEQSAVHSVHSTHGPASITARCCALVPALLSADGCAGLQPSLQTSEFVATAQRKVPP